LEKRKRRKPRNNDPVVQHLDEIRRLLMLQLVVSGVQAKDIAVVLGVNKSAISGIVPARAVRKLKASVDG
jgi:hypothetical protein